MRTLTVQKIQELEELLNDSVLLAITMDDLLEESCDSFDVKPEWFTWKLKLELVEDEDS